MWLIDNESAFLSAYSLIYGEDNKDGTRFAEFHRRLLETNCVFRRKTIQRLFALVKSPDPSQLLLRYGIKSESKNINDTFHYSASIARSKGLLESFC